ncbi:proteasome inhibitor PI31 subunit-like [Scaptodrosophila lebanonensis]|uniref:Proteasome inhibitor PI31 subunit n=1 Tax=Drosophila lebanonensis TaxID=7225 RepID=A0A6J2TPU2_DROLE|nr:proteasome inhibitor PI31 subunit-like [Scaptodrosophila lebanonensis]
MDRKPNSSTTICTLFTVSHSDYIYGLDLLLKAIEKSMHTKEDLLVALSHFLLTKHYEMGCVGNGDEEILRTNETGSEWLPDNWNANGTKYALRYVHGKELYLLIGHKRKDTLILNLFDTRAKSESSISLEPHSLVFAIKGSLTICIPTISQVVDRFRNELFSPILSGKFRNVSTQTINNSVSECRRNSDQLCIGSRSWFVSSPCGRGRYPFHPRSRIFPNYIEQVRE